MRYDIHEDHFPIRHAVFPSSPGKILACHFLRGTITWNDRNLSAPYWRFYWNPSGMASIHYKEQTIALDERTIALIAPGISFRKSARTFIEHFHIHFTASPDMDRAFGKSLQSLKAAPRVISYMRQAIALLNDNRASSLFFQALTSHLVSWALMELSRGCPQAEMRDRRLHDACNFINEHYAGQIENQTLAEIAGMNKNAFIRFFKEAMGQTPQSYIQQKRIDMACILLSSPELSVDMIAEKTGFCDRNYFTTVFKRFKNIGPGEFRGKFGSMPGNAGVGPCIVNVTS